VTGATHRARYLFIAGGAAHLRDSCRISAAVEEEEAAVVVAVASEAAAFANAE